MNNRER